MTVTGPDGKEYPSGDLEPRVKCTTCHEYKPLSAFHFCAQNTARHQRHYSCRSCRQAYDAAQRGRDGAMVDATRVAREARRDLVAQLYDQGFKLKEIAERVGVVHSTISRDLQARGRHGERASVIRATGHLPVTNLKIANGVVDQLSELANLVVNGGRVVLPLEELPIPADMAEEWEKNLAHVGKALRYLRSHAKKGNSE